MVDALHVPGSIPGGVLGYLQVTQSFCPHLVALGATQLTYGKTWVCLTVAILVKLKYRDKVPLVCIHSIA